MRSAPGRGRGGAAAGLRASSATARTNLRCRLHGARRPRAGRRRSRPRRPAPPPHRSPSRWADAASTPRAPSVRIERVAGLPLGTSASSCTGHMGSVRVRRELTGADDEAGDPVRRVAARSAGARTRELAPRPACDPGAGPESVAAPSRRSRGCWPAVGSPARSAADAVVEVDDAACEPALDREARVGARTSVRQGALAAAHHDRAEEQVALVDQPCTDRVAGELGAPDSRCRPSEDCLSRRRASRSNSRSIRVLTLDAVSSVREYTIFSAARQIAA